MKSRLTKIAVGLGLLTAFALGGAALAGAGSPLDNEEPLRGQELSRASAAALKATGGGKVNETERDDEKGATFEVEVTRPDGTTVDVRLDAAYGVVAVDGDSEESDDSGAEESGDDE